MLTIVAYILLAVAVIVAAVTVYLLADARGSARSLATSLNRRFARRGEPLIQRPVSRTEVRLYAAVAGTGDVFAAGALLAL